MNSIRVQLFVVLAALVAQTNAWCQTSSSSLKSLVRANLPVVVTIETFDAAGGAVGSGSGIIVSSNGVIVTNFHVIDGANSAKVYLNGGESYRVEGVVEVDPEKDFALIKIPAVELPVARMGNSNTVEIGERVVAIGSPLGLSGTVSEGVISQVRPMGEYKMIQHTAAISPGSSGGALLNENGEVIGVNTLQYKDGQNLNFALPFNYVRGTLSGATKIKMSLSELNTVVQKVKTETATKKMAKALDDAFVTHNDPGGIFTAMLPRDWQIQRNEFFDNNKKATVIEIVAASREGRIPHNKQTWISEGVMFVFLIPEKGKEWTKKYQSDAQGDFYNSVLVQYKKQKSSKVAATKLGNLSLFGVRGVGEADILDQHESFVVYTYASENVIMFVTLSVPSDPPDLVTLVDTMLQESFRASWVK